MLGFGFGFVEVGTLTPRPQTGNPKPRLFRLAEDRAVINRMGFNNRGIADALPRLAADRARDGRAQCRREQGQCRPGGGLCRGGVRDPGFGGLSHHQHFLAQHPGLRALQDEGALAELLAAVAEVRGDTPIFLKVAPDLEKPEIDGIAKAALDHRIDALIVANTTIGRPRLRSKHREEAGGLSGAPLKALALRRLRDFRSATGGALPLIAAGGIENGVDAFERIRAGASLVQLYTALVYRGPALAAEINGELKRLLAVNGFANISEAIGTNA